MHDKLEAVYIKLLVHDLLCLLQSRGVGWGGLVIQVYVLICQSLSLGMKAEEFNYR